MLRPQGKWTLYLCNGPKTEGVCTRESHDRNSFKTTTLAIYREWVGGLQEWKQAQLEMKEDGGLDQGTGGEDEDKWAKFEVYFGDGMDSSC